MRDFGVSASVELVGECLLTQLQRLLPAIDVAPVAQHQSVPATQALFPGP